MGLKFKNKLTAGKPVAGEVAEREILFNLKDKEIYSSITGTDIVKIGGEDQNAVKSFAAGSEIRIAEIVRISQSDYDAIGSKQADKLYIIVG